MEQTIPGGDLDLVLHQLVASSVSTPLLMDTGTNMNNSDNNNNMNMNMNDPLIEFTFTLPLFFRFLSRSLTNSLTHSCALLVPLYKLADTVQALLGRVHYIHHYARNTMIIRPPTFEGLDE